MTKYNGVEIFNFNDVICGWPLRKFTIANQSDDTFGYVAILRQLELFHFSYIEVKPKTSPDD
jgi:hypothetical protein